MAETSAFSLLVIGAHPDDCEFGAGGLAALCRRAGHQVMFISVTNGDAGHHLEGGGPLARRRLAETRAVAELMQLDYLVLDHHDGELEPSLANRWELVDIIRRIAPDLVLTHRLGDYHPDHRATAQLVLDASYLAKVPNIRALTPALRQKPVIGYLYDDFQRPVPFQPDLVIDIGSVVEQKLQMLDAHTSQVYEWLPFASGQAEPVFPDAAARQSWLQSTYLDTDQRLAERLRPQLAVRYGETHAAQVRFAEAFEISEYGQPWSKELEAKLGSVLPTPAGQA
ncbi:PIG-L family deacetylase [Deinococcus psychrotolerans]|uniref:PIG-L family deacetylase n=1 Tax=Deinococcus psychrotolerans TaxID=2489213 RepID=A0A3G8YG52_9DEIO|nr:PIG-L deacetylase family protein [Deinococcus psychrotolerans]AZI44319.1 PIG-L family deacetylase [Deinococcus psychrotolerans]